MSNKIKKIYRKKHKSYVAIIVLVLMAVLITIAYLYSDSIFAELVIARNNKGASAAFSLAEAGVQEAIYRVKYDETTKNTFLTSENGVSNFSHDPALIDQGKYFVSIENSAPAVATITSVGEYRVGALRVARREIRVGIAQAAEDPAYPYDGAIFGAGGAGNSIADLDFWYAEVNIFNGSLFSNRDINLKFGAKLNVENKIEANRSVTKDLASSHNCQCSIDGSNPALPLCSSKPGCVPDETAVSRSMPPIDFNSTSPNSYKNRAIAANQYFSTQREFKDLAPRNSSTTFNGVIYIDGPLDIDNKRDITVNGVIAASGSIDITDGSLTINSPGANQASGVLTQQDFRVGSHGDFDGTGLVYSGDRTQVDSSNSKPIDFTGAVLSRRTWFTGYRVINLHFNQDVVNWTIGNPTDTPVIEVNHWEENY